MSMTKFGGFDTAVSIGLGGNTSILPTRLELEGFTLRNNDVRPAEY